MQSAEHKLPEMVSVGRQGESAYVSRDELCSETRRVRMEVQAMQQDYLDKLAAFQEQLSQAAVLVPEVTTKAFSDKSPITQLSETAEEEAGPIGSDLAAVPSK